MNRIFVRLERTWTRKRAWLKAVDARGLQGILNVPAEDALAAQAELVERLTAAGLYDEVIAEPVEAWLRKGN